MSSSEIKKEVERELWSIDRTVNKMFTKYRIPIPPLIDNNCDPLVDPKEVICLRVFLLIITIYICNDCIQPIIPNVEKKHNTMSNIFFYFVPFPSSLCNFCWFWILNTFFPITRSFWQILHFSLNSNSLRNCNPLCLFSVCIFLGIFFRHL